MQEAGATYPDEYLIESGLDPAQWRDVTFYEGVGCFECGGTGFRGRSAIHELLDLSEPIRELILNKRPSSEIRRKAREEGMTFLRESALEKAATGVTTLKEINKVTFIEAELDANMSFLSHITRLVKDPPPSHLFELSEAGIAFSRHGQTGFQPLRAGHAGGFSAGGQRAAAGRVQRRHPAHRAVERRQEAPSRPPSFCPITPRASACSISIPFRRLPKNSLRWCASA